MERSVAETVRRWAPAVLFLMLAALAVNRFRLWLPPVTANDRVLTQPLSVIFNGDFDWPLLPPLRNVEPFHLFSGNWHVDYDGSQPDFTISRQVEGGKPYFHWEQKARGRGQSFNRLEYFVPGANTFANSFVNLAFRVRCGQPATITVRLFRDAGDGTGKGPASSTAVTAAREWTEYRASFRVAPLPHAGPGPEGHLALSFELPDLDSFVCDITDVRLEVAGTR